MFDSFYTLNKSLWEWECQHSLYSIPNSGLFDWFEIITTKSGLFTFITIFYKLQRNGHFNVFL